MSKTKDKKKITKKEWAKFVAKNSGDSYSFVVCYCILAIWEYGCKDEETAGKLLREMKLGLSGMQAEAAIQYALSTDAEEWLDESMTSIVRKNDNKS